jgi:hypothetical protein
MKRMPLRKPFWLIVQSVKNHVSGYHPSSGTSAEPILAADYSVFLIIFMAAVPLQLKYPTIAGE